ncbi:hypothetical protein QZH41_016240 [Actinostola sp. cb2023]|nr:hypothetical protein QZH41_016240 [Actinostola sp. cb2023]
MRQLSRLLQELQKQHASASLIDVIDTRYFDDIVIAVKSLCKFDETEHLKVDTPSLALKLGHSLKKCAQLVKTIALKRNDDIMLKKAKRFLELFENEWTTQISSRSLASMGAKKHNTIDYLPLTEDLEKVRQNLTSKIASLSACIQKSDGPQTHHGTWFELAKATLARIIMFNKRRSGETGTLEIEKFKSRPNWSTCDSTLKSTLTPLERRLCERMDLVEIGGKRGRKVPILLSKETREAVELLISSRPVGISKANKYVFARPTKESQGHLRGWDCLHDSVQEVKNLKEPAYITSTKLRKYIATVSQTAALTEVDVDWLARHLGHDVRVHRDFYRLHESTAELAKVSKLLLAVDNGNLESLKGKTLAELNVDGTYCAFCNQTIKVLDGPIP